MYRSPDQNSYPNSIIFASLSRVLQLCVYQLFLSPFYQGSALLLPILLPILIVLVLHSPLTSHPSQMAGKGEELRIQKIQALTTLAQPINKKKKIWSGAHKKILKNKTQVSQKIVFQKQKMNNEMRNKWKVQKLSFHAMPIGFYALHLVDAKTTCWSYFLSPT